MSKQLVNLAHLRRIEEDDSGAYRVPAVVITFTDGGTTGVVTPKDITVFGHGEQLVREWLKGLDSKTEED